VKLEQHPLSAAFPRMDEDAFQSLKDSIESMGVQRPITLHGGMVLDGWNRYMACQELCMQCPTEYLPDNVDPREFVRALNKERRHLTPSQWAVAEVALWEWMPAGSNQHGGVAPGATPAKTNGEMAKNAGVSERTIRQAKRVQQHAAPEVVEKVKEGEVSLKKAAAVASLPKDQQVAALETTAAAKRDGHDEAPTSISTRNGSESDADELADLREQLAELQSSHAETIADNDAMGKIFDSDDRLAAAMAEVKRLREMNRVFEERIRSQQNKENELIRMVKSLQRKLKTIAQTA
jgi:hypothetical protein